MLVNFRHVYTLTEPGKIKIRYIIIFLCLYFTGPASLFLSGVHFLGIIGFLILATLYMIVSSTKANIDKNYPFGYIISIYLLLFSFMILFILGLFNNSEILGYAIAVDLFLYGFIGSFIIINLLNIVYIFCLKRMFPYEKRDDKKQKINVSRKKLSEYIDLEKQKVYFNIVLINAAIYFFFVIFFIILLIRHIPIGSGTIPLVFSNWLEKQEWANFSNSIGVISLLITFYSITIPAQNRIINEARERYKERYKDYFSQNSYKSEIIRTKQK